MLCRSCGNENPEYAGFCITCGKQLEQEVSSVSTVSIDQQIPVLPEANTIDNDVPTQEQTNLSDNLSLATQGQLYLHDQTLSDQASNHEPTIIINTAVPLTNPASQISHDEFLVGYMGTAPQQPPMQIESGFKALAAPLPIWAILVGGLVIALVLVILQLAGSDWAAGALNVALTAGILALLIAVATGIRAVAGMKLVRQYVGSGLTILVLTGLCITGITQQSALHRFQGNYLEGQQKWEKAINEYQLSGESAPISNDIARVYLKWGEQFAHSNNYEAAIGKFDIVINNYTSATTQLTLAQSDEIAAYTAWGKQAAMQQDYPTAISRFNTLLKLPFCSTQCQTTVSALDATAYFNIAENQLSAQKYIDALTTFDLILKRFPGSSEAQKIHGEYAKALLGKGKELFASICASAIPTYQQLAKDFADTPEGQQAAKDLAAPQPVLGHFITAIPNDPALTPMVALLPRYNQNITGTQFYLLLDSAPKAQIQSNGKFVFQALPQGTLYLVFGTDRNNGSQVYYITYNTYNHSPGYAATIGPLCPFDYGDINETIPIA